MGKSSSISIGLRTETISGRNQLMEAHRTRLRIFRVWTCSHLTGPRTANNSPSAVAFIPVTSCWWKTRGRLNRDSNILGSFPPHSRVGLASAGKDLNVTACIFDELFFMASVTLWVSVPLIT